MEDWKENFVRRAAETEEMLLEKLRNMRIQNERVEDELREVRRKMREMSEQRPTASTHPSNGRRYQGPMGFGETVSNDRDAHEMTSRRPGGRMREDDGPTRPRASTFGGASASRPVSGRMDSQRTEGTGIEPRGAAAAETVVKPLPQRGVNTRSRRRGGNRAGERSDPATETQLRDWLSTAKSGEAKAAETPVKRPETPEVMISPSWADQDVSDDTSEEDCDHGTTTPPIGRTASSGAARAERMVEEHVDIYEIPPSGQATGGNGVGVSTSNNRGHGGARPKSLGKNAGNNDKSYKEGNESGKTNAAKGNQKPGNNGGKTYAKVVTKNGWRPAKKRRVEKVSPKSAPKLKGKPATRNKDVYVQGLAVDDCEDEDDMIDMVRSYCKAANVVPIYIRLIPVKFDCTRTGCRLTVKECDYDDVLNDDFWPDDVYAREWRRNKDNDEEGDRHPSGDEGY